MIKITKNKVFFLIVFLFNFFYSNSSIGSICKAISLINNINRSVAIFDFDVVPFYTIFSLHAPERIVMDIWNISKIKTDILPIKYYYTNNLIQCIRISSPVEPHSIRIVLDIIYPFDIEIITYRKIEHNCRVILTISKKVFFETFRIQLCKKIYTVYKNNCIEFNQIKNYLKKSFFDRFGKQEHNNQQMKKCFPVLVAIDAGHGGQDPGATGYHGVYEKDVTIDIAKKLKILLDSDSRFKPILIRDNDSFLSVMERSDIARKKGANILISIHADSSLNSNVRGASVWVLSNRRAKSEMLNWLKCREKHAELLGGIGDILINYRHTPYLSHVVLDLQFGYSQRVGYEVAMHILNQLKNVSILHKNMPEYSSFGVLCSPDIPSILVETGFISNILDANLLVNNKYQEKLAIALYKGLCAHFILQ